MRAELPEVEHVLAELNSHDQIEAVHRGELDLGFIHANPLPEGVQAQDLVAEPFVVCLPSGHALARRGSLALVELAGEDFVFFARGLAQLLRDGAVAVRDGRLHAAGAARGASLAERGRAGVAGAGVAIVPASPVAQRAGRHALHRLRARGALGQSGDLAGRGRTPLQESAMRLVMARMPTLRPEAG